MNWYTFDIETGPLPKVELSAMCPPFDRDEVKTGNLKDPAKVEAKLAEAEKNHFADFVERAALCASTGRVLVVGIHDCNVNESVLIEGEENEVLKEFWSFAWDIKKARHRMAGVNICDFDLPFLVRRSWILGVPVPLWVVEIDSKWCNWDSMWFDLRLAWQLGNRQATSNFDHIGKALRTGGKTAGDHGKNFHEVYEKDRETAIAYLKNDLIQPAEWLVKLGLCKSTTKPKPKPEAQKEVAIDDI